MADVLFNPSWSGTLSLKAASTQVDIPLLSGTGFGRPTPFLTPNMAQGSAGNAFATNNVPGRKTSSLGIQTYGFSTILSTAFLGAALLTRTAAGDITMYGAQYTPYNGATEKDSVKLGSMNISCAADSPVELGMGFLGLGAITTAETFVAATAVAGLPFYFKDITVSFGPVGTPTAATLVHSWSLNLSTGAHYAAVFDQQDYASMIDPGILGGKFSIVQRPGATNRVAASASGEFTLAFASGPTIKVQARRDNLVKSIDAYGAALDVSSWTINSLAGNAPVTVS